MNDSLHSVLSLLAFVIEEAHRRGFSSLSAALPPLRSADSVVSSISTATTDNLALAQQNCLIADVEAALHRTDSQCEDAERKKVEGEAKTDNSFH